MKRLNKCECYGRIVYKRWTALTHHHVVHSGLRGGPPTPIERACLGFDPLLPQLVSHEPSGAYQPQTREPH